jgi:hypothetical protein
VYPYLSARQGGFAALSGGEKENSSTNDSGPGGAARAEKSEKEVDCRSGGPEYLALRNNVLVLVSCVPARETSDVVVDDVVLYCVVQ